ncbi:MAG: Rpn family recombination-promoting nuclease/putative transposase, partial [Deltaproteobacteria bacterium]|nr:Rpn family recombination-promoting nuclease/putative transposase [Deltaproteobacteria bacterium]
MTKPASLSTDFNFKAMVLYDKSLRFLRYLISIFFPQLNVTGVRIKEGEDYNSFINDISKLIDKGLNKDITIQDSELLILYRNKLSVRFDVFATLYSGEKVVIEMQANHMKGDNFLNNHIHLFNRA